jgi:formylglycine-generating enzyme required for sulfatase activity
MHWRKLSGMFPLLVGLALMIPAAGCADADGELSVARSEQASDQQGKDAEAAAESASESSAEGECCDPPSRFDQKAQPKAKADNDYSRLPDPATADVPDAGKIEPTKVGDAEPPEPAPKGMLWIPPGKFSMGSAYEPFGDARPIHSVELDGFWLDETPVTNRQFAAFVQDTGYLTVAERKPDPKDFPGVPEEALVPGSLVFTPPEGPVPLHDFRAWWAYVPGACWKRPEGPQSGIVGREDHPVVQVCYLDAIEYAKWAGKRLPTEAEWEYAARGGLTQQPYVWGDEFEPDGKSMANSWQGRFPNQNTAADGWPRTSPVKAFPPNGFGLFDMAGNVWEWCSDWYRPDYYAKSPAHDPQGPDDSFDPDEPGLPKRVQRGGSFLCSDQYCSRYMPGGRGKGAIDTGSSHVGFRCAKSAD